MPISLCFCRSAIHLVAERAIVRSAVAKLRAICPELDKRASSVATKAILRVARDPTEPSAHNSSLLMTLNFRPPPR
jgi:hypothetical protein